MIVRKVVRFLNKQLFEPSRSVESDPFSRTTSSSFPFISGDTFAAAAQFLVSDSGTTHRHGLDTSIIFATPNVANSGWFIGELEDLVNRLKNKGEAALVVHGGDSCLPSGQLLKLLEVVPRVFCQNLVEPVPGVTALPLGLENLRLRKNGRLHYYFDGLESSSPGETRNRLVLSSFHESTNPKIRTAAKRALELSRHGHEQRFFKSLEYRLEVRKTKFVISPPGSGTDCHRTWEAIYLGAVPVVLEGTLSKTLADSLPIMEVPSYESFCNLSDFELNDQFQKLRSRSLQKAFAPYWLSEILGDR